MRNRWPLPAALLAVLLALAAIAPASATPPCGVGSHPACETPGPTPEPTRTPDGTPEMAVASLAGFETNSLAADSDLSLVANGTSAISSVQARTGTFSFRMNPASGAQGYLSNAPSAVWEHFGLYIATAPSVARIIGGDAAGTDNNLLLNTDGTISVRKGSTLIGTSSASLVTGRWYWIGWNNQTTVTGVLLQIDAVDQVSGTSGAAANILGCFGTEASAIDIYIDDIISDLAGFLNPSRVGLAVPISDSGHVDWTNDAGTTTNLFDAIDNKPPVGIADTTGSTGLHQIRDATNGTDTFVANMTTYASLGIGPTDTVIGTQPFALTGAPSATSPKSGSLTVSNPTMAKASFGTFYEGSTIAGTFPSGWIRRRINTLAAPTVTIANSPVITVTQDTSSTRIAMVCFIGLYVAWTPGALGKIKSVNQAVARAANY